MRDGIVGAALCVVVLAAAVGCQVRVNNSGSGDGENVKIATPFGGISVNKDQASPAEIGLPAYPGAVVYNDTDGQSAKVDMGFGSWKLRVRVAQYTTADSRDQVLSFYRKALSEYGGVIECAGNKPVGNPAKTVEGLSCDDSSQVPSEHNHGSPHSNFGARDLELKAGSPRHQHLVVLKGTSGSPTHFSLIALDLPHGSPNEQKGTN